MVQTFNFWVCLGQNSTNTPDSATLESICYHIGHKKSQDCLSKSKESCRNLGEKLKDTRGQVLGGQSALPPSRQWESQTQTNISRREAAASPCKPHGHNPYSHRASSRASNRAKELAPLIPGMVRTTNTGWPQQKYYGITLSRKPHRTGTPITVLRQFLCSFKVIDTLLLQWTIKLLRQSNSVLHLAPRQE